MGMERDETRPRRHRCNFAAFAAALICGLAACDNSDPQHAAPPPPPPPPPAAPAAVAPGTGTLVVAVNDPEGRPLADARVSVFNSRQTQTVGSAHTSSTGVAIVEAVPATARVSVLHAFGEYYRNDNVPVAQTGTTFLSVTLRPGRPTPTAALLPVSIPPERINEDRSELTVEITIAVSASTPLAPSSYHSGSNTESTPLLGFNVGDADPWGRWLCSVWLDRQRTVPSCGPSSGPSPYTATVEQYSYDHTGTTPTLAAPTPAHSAMLLVDQSGRVAELDPTGRRSFALRRFVERALVLSRPERLAIVGFAGRGSGATAATPLLPQQPLWSPLGAEAVFSSDRATLDSAVGALEPLIGGSAPVLGALRSALTLTTEQTSAGNRAIVAMLGGGDDSGLSEAASRAALAELRQARDAAGIQAVVINGAPEAARADRQAAAQLAGVLRAPAVYLGMSNFVDGVTPWAAGSYAALDLAADLLEGRPLPTLSATFRVSSAPGTFAAGTILGGAVFLETDFCSFGCATLPLEFAVEIP